MPKILPVATGESAQAVDMSLLAEQLAQSEKISRLASGSSAPETAAHKLRISSELLQDAVLKLLLADAQGQGLKPADTVSLARALKEMLVMHERLATHAERTTDNAVSQSQAVKQAMRALGLLGAGQAAKHKPPAALPAKAGKK